LTARQTQEDRLQGLADYLGDGTLTRGEYLRQKKRLQARWDELDGQIAEVRARSPRRRLRGATPEGLRQEWEQLDLEDKRAVLADHVERVIVQRVGPGRRPLDPDSIQILWREG
jgi:hypothetical protein